MSFDQISNKPVAIITGASSGLGVAIAHALSEDGFALVLAARRTERGDALAAEINEGGGVAHFVRADLTREDDIKRVHDEALRTFGRIDVAVNNAGVHRMQGATESSIADYTAIMDTNVKAVWLGMKHQIAAFREQGSGGRIVNIASNVAHNGAGNMVLYSASKHAVLGLTKSAAIDHAKEGILINAVSPGPTKTEMFDGAVNGDDEMEQAIRNWMPIGRIGEGEDVANAVRWLVSDRAGLVVGHSLVVDGGTLAGFAG